MIEDMKCVYDEMLSDMIKPDIYTFNTMINAYCKLGNVVGAYLYLSKILQAGLNPDTHRLYWGILGERMWIVLLRCLSKCLRRVV